MRDAVEWIRKNSHDVVVRGPDGPLDDLRPLAPLVRDAEVVALGTSARQTHELAVTAHRIVRLLVEEEGFRTLALEGDDAVGLGLDAYVATGQGDPRAIVAGARPFWRFTEILDVVHWMRSHNLRHPDDPVRFAPQPGEPGRRGTPITDPAELERSLADDVTSWRERTGDKIVYWGGLAHTAVGNARAVSPAPAPDAHRNMGGHLRERLGRGYRSIGLTMARGSIGVPLPPPSAGFIDAVLSEAAEGGEGYILDLRGARPEAVRGTLDVPTRTRLVGPAYDPRDDAAHHLSGGSLAEWFDAVVHVDRVTPARPLASGGP